MARPRVAGSRVPRKLISTIDLAGHACLTFIAEFEGAGSWREALQGRLVCLSM